MTNKFKQAKEIDIFDANGKKWEGQKGLVNADDELDRFAIVGVGYKIAQHEEVYDIVEKALVDLKVEHNTRTTEMKNGARLRIDLMFPEITHTIAGEKIQLWASFDNSYDSSTGLRLEINAYIPAYETSLYCSEVVTDELNRYYHRHTKGLEVGMLDGTISKGIELFQTRIGKEFEDLLNTPISMNEAKAFIQELLEDKKVKTAKKYLEKIEENISDRITNGWVFYTLVSSILTKEVESVDVRKNNAREILGKIKKQKWGSSVLRLKSEAVVEFSNETGTEVTEMKMAE